MMTHLKRAIALLAFLSLSSAAAFADTINFSFSFSGSGQSGSGVLTATSTKKANQYLITGVTGVLDGSAIKRLAGPGPTSPGYALADDLLISSTSGSQWSMDLYGISMVNAAGLYMNLFSATSNCGTAYYFVSGKSLTEFSQGGELARFTLTPMAPTPEPSSFILVGTALLGFAGMMRRRMVASV